MADNVTIPATGTGTATPVIATDDAGVGGHVQIVKLAVSADATATPIPADAITGLAVDPTDDALRDLGKVDVASLDQYVPIDVDTGAGTVNAVPVTWRKSAATGPEFGTATDPVRVDPTGTTTQPVSGTVTANQGTAGAGGWEIQGDVAHDSPSPTNPVFVGGQAKAFGSAPTAVADADVTKLYANRHGVLFILGGHPNAFSEESVFTAAQTDTALKTIATGNKIAITRASVTLDKDTTVTVSYRLGFATATLPATGTGVAGIVSSHPGLAAGSGQTEGSGGGVLGVGTDDQDLRFTCDVPTGGAIRVVVSGFVIES